MSLHPDARNPVRAIELAGEDMGLFGIKGIAIDRDGWAKCGVKEGAP